MSSCCGERLQFALALLLVMTSAWTVHLTIDRMLSACTVRLAGLGGEILWPAPSPLLSFSMDPMAERRHLLPLDEKASKDEDGIEELGQALDVLVSTQHQRQLLRRTRFAQETSNNNGLDEDVTTEILPVVMIGMASAVIVCATLMYLLDLRDRCRHLQVLEDQHQHPEVTSHKQIQSASTASSKSPQENVLIIRHSSQPSPMLLPVPNEDDEDMELALANDIDNTFEHVSLSRVSSMTASLADDRMSPYEYDLEEEDEVPVLMQLSDEHRVDQSTDLASLVKSPDRRVRRKTTPVTSPARSSCTSLADISEGTETTTTPKFDGEAVFKRDAAVMPKENNSSTRLSLVYSPDTTRDEERDETDQDNYCESENDGEDARADVERPEEKDQPVLYAEDVDITPAKEYVRDVFFCPIALGSVNLGLDIHDAPCATSYPSISAVDAKSPLVGRICEGDFVLQVNDVDTAGLLADQVLSIILSGTKQPSVPQMVKLTVMSSFCDEEDSNMEGSYGSEDFGLIDDSAVEV